MGIWIAEPALDGSEAVMWQHLASRAQSARRDVSGRLYLTTTRLLFEPSRLDAVTGGRRWSAALTSIRSVSVKPWNEVVFNRSSRNLLRLDLADGSLELFWILGLDNAVSVIQGAIAWRTNVNLSHGRLRQLWPHQARAAQSASLTARCHIPILPPEPGRSLAGSPVIEASLGVLCARHL